MTADLLTDRELQSLRNMGGLAERAADQIANQRGTWTLHAFKNFHRLLCERFGYSHDEQDWQRDQLSLIEFIAAKIPAPAEAHGVTVADILAEFDRRAEPGTGFYEPEEPAQIIRAMLAANPQPKGTVLPEHADHVREIAIRLRRLGRTAGVADCIPDDDHTAVGAIFTVLGSMAGAMERAHGADHDVWMNDYFTLLGDAEIRRSAGETDMPAYLLELAGRIAKAHLDEGYVQRAAELRAAAPAQSPAPAPDVDGGDLPCPRCNGSGFELQWSDASPDAHQVEVNCDHCDGGGSLGAAYTHLSQMLKRERERSKKHTDELHWLKSGPFFGLRADKSIQTVADRLDELADACGKYDPHSERASDIRAAATIWRKHLAGPSFASPAVMDGKEIYTPYWQGGLSNAELAQWWRLKTKAEPTDRDMSCFALGVEVGCGTNPAPKPEDLARAVAPGEKQ